MGDGLTVDTAAADRLAGDLDRVAAALADPAPLVTDLANTITRVAGGRVPRATGTLANSFSLDRATVDGNPAAVLTWGARYAVFVNYGTVHMAARPFATDALAAATADADRALAQWADTTLNAL